MLQFLLDTDHLTLIQYQHPPLLQRLGMHSGEVAICPINIEEIMRGRLAVLGRVLTGFKHVEAYTRLVAAEAVFRLFPVVPFDDACEIELQQLRAARLRVGTLDLKIAANALINGLTVLTRNSRDFGRVPGLAIEDWSV